MRICVDWGNNNKKVGLDCKNIYEYLSDDETIAFLRDCILEMDIDEIKQTLDTLVEIVKYMEEHYEEYGEIDTKSLTVEPGYSSLYKMCDGGVWVGK